MAKKPYEKVIKLVFKDAYPQQEKFYNAMNAHIAYGGARGGGKSEAMRTKFVHLSLLYPGLKLLLLRRTFPELRENHIIPLKLMLHSEEKDGRIATYNDTEKAFIFPNGSRLKLGYCDSEDDVFQYQGQEYEVIGLEEATHFTESQMRFLTTCNRTTREDFAPRMYYTANPGGVGHQWFKRLFVDRDFTDDENPDDYVFFPAKVTDNIALMKNNPGYYRNLLNLPEDQRRAYLDGDWNVVEGQFFKEFNRDIHVVEPFQIPDNWYKYRALDYGLDMLACYWIAVDMQDNAYIYKELHESNLIITEAAKKIIEYSKGEDIRTTYAPPDLWNRRQDTGMSATEIFLKNGVPFLKSKNHRINGWLAVKEYLKIVERRDEQTGENYKTAKLKIFSTCKNLIRCLPQLRHDEREPNDCSKDPHDITHAPDALRYFCTMRTLSPEMPQEYRRDDFFSSRERELNTAEDVLGGEIPENFL